LSLELYWTAHECTIQQKHNAFKDMDQLKKHEKCHENTWKHMKTHENTWKHMKNTWKIHVNHMKTFKKTTHRNFVKDHKHSPISV